MHKVLVVYDHVPESTATFLLEVEDEALTLLQSAHGVLAGSTHEREEDAMKVWHLLYDEETGEARHPEFEGTALPDGITHLIKTGFVL